MRQVQLIFINSVGCEPVLLRTHIMLTEIYAINEVAVLIMRIYNLSPLQNAIRYY